MVVYREGLGEYLTNRVLSLTNIRELSIAMGVPYWVLRDALLYSSKWALKKLRNSAFRAPTRRRGTYYPKRSVRGKIQKFIGKERLAHMQRFVLGTGPYGFKRKAIAPDADSSYAKQVENTWQKDNTRGHYPGDKKRWKNDSLVGLKMSYAGGWSKGWKKDFVTVL